MHVMWADDAPHPMRADMGKLSFFGVALIGGAAVALLVALARRPAKSSSEQSCCGRGSRWWPALLFLPLVLFFFLFMARVRESRHFELVPPTPVPPIHHGDHQAAATLHHQEHELARRTAEIRRRIEQMDIHELMDRFDAPRIVISGPRPATIPWLALAPLAASSAARIGEANSADAALVGEAAEAEDNALQVDAAAAVKLITAEAAETRPASDSGNASVAESDQAGAVSTSGQNVEQDWSSQHLSTPIGEEHTKPKVDPDRPDWVNSPRQHVGEVWREVLVTEEWSTEPECQRAADIGLLLKTYEHVQRLVGDSFDRRWPDYRLIAGEPGEVNYRLDQLRSAGITVDFIRREIAKAEYLETVNRSVGPMMKLHTLVEFTPSVDRDLRRYWDSYRRQARLAGVGLGAGGILSLLGLAYGLLKVDTWTKGYYTKRLFLGVPAAIISLVGLLALVIELN
jgi:hypothetical protein